MTDGKGRLRPTLSHAGWNVRYFPILPHWAAVEFIHETSGPLGAPQIIYPQCGHFRHTGLCPMLGCVSLPYHGHQLLSLRATAGALMQPWGYLLSPSSFCPGCSLSLNGSSDN